MKKYNHAFDFAFTLIHSDKTGEQVTAQEFRTAILRRLAALTDDELVECCGAPFDSFEYESEEAAAGGSLPDLFLVSGRVHGADDDTAMIIQACSQESAEDAFKATLDDDDESLTVYINQSEPLVAAMTQRVIQK